MLKCSACGRENDDTFRFCLDCGKPLGPAEPDQAAPTDPEASVATGQMPASAPHPAPEPQPAAEAAPQPAPEPAPQPTAEAAPVPEPAPAQPPEPEPAPEPVPEATAPQADGAGACPKCGAAAHPGDVFCASCGQNLKDAPKAKSTMFMHTPSPDQAGKPKIRLVLIKPDGSEGTVFTLAEKTAIGRTQGMIMFPKDPYISPKHAELRSEGDKLVIEDLHSLNGVYRKMTAEEQISPGTYFRIGRQLLRLEVPGEFQPLPVKAPEGDDSQYWGSPAPNVWARLVQVLEGGKIGEIHLLTQGEVIIGREDGGVRFPEDGFISSSHCKLTNSGGECRLADLGSSNGTYLRIRGSHELGKGDRIQIGNQVLRIDIS